MLCGLAAAGSLCQQSLPTSECPPAVCHSFSSVDVQGDQWAEGWGEDVGGGERMKGEYKGSQHNGWAGKRQHRMLGKRQEEDN